MDIGGFLGSIFHNIGSFFGGGSNNNQPQQPQQHQQFTPQGANPIGSFSQPSQPNNNSVQQPQQQQAPQQPAAAPWVNLQKANTQAKPAAPTQPQQSAPQQPAASLQRIVPGQIQGDAAGGPLPTLTSIGVNEPKQTVTGNPNNGGLGAPFNNFVQGVAAPFVTLTKAAVDAPGAIANAINGNNAANTQMGKQDFGTDDPLKIAEKVGGSAANAALTVAAPGVDSGIADLAEGALPIVGKIGSKIIGGALTGAGLGGSSAMSNGGDIKSVADATALGSVIGGGAGLIGGGLAKVAPKSATDATGSDAIPAPDEVAVGVKSANPNQTNDAIQQIEQKAANESGQVPGQPTPQPTEPGAQPGEVPPSNPVQPTEVPGQTPQTPGTPQVPESVTNGENVSSTPNVAQTDNRVNGPTSDRTAPNAPNVRQQMGKQLGAAADKAGDPTVHDVLSNPELDTAAKNAVAATPDQDLLTRYSGVPDLTKASDLAHGNAALQRFAELSKSADPEVASSAKQAIDNIMEGAEKGVSSGGRTMNYAQSMFDNLPKEAKIPMIIRTLDKAREAGGLTKIADDLPQRAQVEATLDNLLTKGEDVSGKLAANEGRIQEIQDAAKAGSVDDVKGASKELDGLLKDHQQLELASQAQNGDTARYYNSLVPGKSGLENAANWARTSMLTAPSGRIKNVFNVGGNSLYEIARSIPQAAMNKVINAVRGAGTVEGKSLLNKGLASGFKGGLKTTASELKGNSLVDGLKSGTNARDVNTNAYELVKTGDNRGLNKVRNVTQALVKAPSNIIGGAMKGAQLARSAAKEGASLGLQGDDLKVYTQARSIVPSKEMADNAKLLQDTVSHMNKNPFASVFTNLDKAASTSQAKGVVGMIKNTLLAFPKYPATFVWNTLTDRNVAADVVNIAKGARAGDVNAVTKAISGLGVDAAAMGVGYHLMNSGIITTKDANGYSDSGLYLHVGSRYIPLGLGGVVAEPLIAGAAIQQAVTGKGDPISKFGSVIGNTIVNTIKEAGAQSLVGADNSTIQEATKALNGTDGVTPGDVAAVAGEQGASQFVPGATSDVNAILNNSPLNPTGAAANTKVTKGSLGVLTKAGTPSTAKSVPQSEVLSLENKVPFLSQTLSRNKAESAPDFVDRVTGGSHTDAPQAQAAQQKQDAANSIQEQLKAGIPIYNAPTGTYPKGVAFSDVVEKTIENGNYDNATKGLQAELADYNKKNMPESKTTPVENQIKQLGILKSQNLSPDFRGTYSGTTLSEWRDMGDPNKSTYNPKLYQALYNYDQSLSNAGIAGGSDTAAGKSDTPKFYAATSKASSSRSASSKASSLVKSNTLGTIALPTRESFTSNLSAKPISVNIPQVKLTTPDSLIKAHKISVSSPKA